MSYFINGHLRNRICFIINRHNLCEIIIVFIHITSASESLRIPIDTCDP